MLCQKCGKNQATVYYKQNINGQQSEVALCADCASQSGIAGKLGGLFGDPFTLGFNFLGGSDGSRARRVNAPTQKVCTLCGSSLRDIVESGKVCCAKCYEVFRDELSGSIERIHGRTTHKGRVPRKASGGAASDDAVASSDNTSSGAAATVKSDNAQPLDELTSLKAQLSDAVKNEDYESAAILRDKIRAIENGSKGEI